MLRSVFYPPVRGADGLRYGGLVIRVFDRDSRILIGYFELKRILEYSIQSTEYVLLTL